MGGRENGVVCRWGFDGAKKIVTDMPENILREKERNYTDTYDMAAQRNRFAKCISMLQKHLRDFLSISY